MARFSSGKKRNVNSVALFTRFVKKVEDLAVEKRQGFVDRKFETLKNKLKFPIVNKRDVLFVYKGEGNKVELMGDMTSWQLFPIPLNKLEGTNLFYLKGRYEEDARLDYKFSVDGTLALDSLNLNIGYGGYGANSELIMPGYLNHPELDYFEGIAHGKIVEELMKCEAVKAGNKVIAERKVSIYLPPNYDKDKRYKVLYFKDGSSYIKFGKAVNILDYMIGKGEIEPILAVFVDPIDREEDYVFSNRDVYVSFFVNQLIPWVEENYSVRNDAEGRVLIGPSAGASIITYIVYKYPEKFRYLLCHSGYFSYAYEEEFGETHGKRIASAPYPVKVFMVVGSYDLDVISTNIWFYSDLKDNPSVKALELRIYPQGHSWGFWRDTLKEGLIWLFSGDN